MILPPKSLSATIGRRVLQVGKKVLLSLAVDSKKLFPHISLLHLKTSAVKIPAIVKLTELLAGKYRKIPLAFTSAYSGSRYFCIATTIPKQLIKLHQEIVKSICQHRTGIIWLPKKPKNNLQKKYFKLYGVGNVLNYFHPHITLGHVKEPTDSPKAIRLVDNFSWKKFVGQRLAVAQVTKEHQVFKIIKEFKLK